MNKAYWYMAMERTYVFKYKVGGIEDPREDRAEERTVRVNAIVWTEHPVIALAACIKNTGNKHVLLYSMLLPNDFPQELVEQFEY